MQHLAVSQIGVGWKIWCTQPSKPQYEAKLHNEFKENGLTGGGGRERDS